MFSGFDSLTEGLKRFSLDALQQDEENNSAREAEKKQKNRAEYDGSKPKPAASLALIQESHNEINSNINIYGTNNRNINVSKKTKLPAAKERHRGEEDEWDWGGEENKDQQKKSASARRKNSTGLARIPTAAFIGSTNNSSSGGLGLENKLTGDTEVVAVSPAEAQEQSVHNDDTRTADADRKVPERKPGGKIVADMVIGGIDGEAKKASRQDSSTDGIVGYPLPFEKDGNSPTGTTAGAQGGERSTSGVMTLLTSCSLVSLHATPPASKQCDTHGEATASDESLPENIHRCVPFKEAAEAKVGVGSAALAASSVGSAQNRGTVAVTTSKNRKSDAETTRSDSKGEFVDFRPSECSDIHVDSEVQEQERFAHESTESGVKVKGATVEGTAENPQVLLVAQENNAFVKLAATEHEGSLRESRSKVQELQGMLATKCETTRQQADELARLRGEVNTMRTGFEESNNAHQRTAERGHAFEQELSVTQRKADNLVAEGSALRGQLNEAKEERQALEAQLRQLRAGLAEGQETARKEGRRGAERLEARLKDLQKERDRKHAELELQNARRKETREMAKDLESQLASGDRLAQEREVELKTLRDEITTLRKTTGGAAEERKNWSAKHDALERNFKQVRAQNIRTETKLEELRQNTTRVEAEKEALAERVEEEGAERVTLVASITHERDFLLRQVDRLEQEMDDLRRSKEAQATAAAARAKTTGVLEEYRTRAQQALKRANEITSETAAENKRLEAEMAKLAAEVAEQRPLWDKSKQLEEIHRVEVVELKKQLVLMETDRAGTAKKMASLEAEVVSTEEAKRNTQASVMRLESQGKSLRQELQRQHKVINAALEKEATLQMRLAEKDSTLQAAEERQRQILAQDGKEGTSDVAKFPRSPLPASFPPSTQWDEGNINNTPRSVLGSEAAAGTLKGRQGSLGSFNSIPSEGESTDAPLESVGEQLFYVQQLRERMSKEQAEMRSLISELEASRTAAGTQAKKQIQLEKQLETALLAKKRLQELDSGRNAAINLEYLKNCVVGCLRTSEPSEHARLLPVISTILKLSKEEADVIAKSISIRAQNEGSFGGSLPRVAPRVPSIDQGSWWRAKPSQKK